MKKLAAILAVLILGCGFAFADTYQGYKIIPISVDGQPYEGSVPAVLLNGTTMVPVRFVSEQLGASVVWNPATASVTITKKQPETEPDVPLSETTIELIEPAAEKVEHTTEELAALAKSCVLIKTYSPVEEGQGSGVIINDEGYIITNYHVVGEAFRFEVVTHDGQTYSQPELINWDEELDLALIRIDADGLSGLPLSDTEATVGNRVVAIGSPLGLQNFVSEGIVGGRYEEEGSVYIQTTAAISPGSSGGALINKYGEVVGITTAKIVGGESLNLAIPVSQVRDFITNSDPTMDYLGIRYDEDGTIYIGELRNGEPHGYGKVSWANGNAYEGYFKNGVIHAQGTYYWSDGDIYMGDWRNGDRTGQGVYRWPDGTIYRGEFIDGVKDGPGIEYDSEILIYGFWNEGELHGPVTAIYSDGTEEVAHFENGVRHGNAVIFYPDGSVEYQYWQEGEMINSKQIK